MEPLFLKGVLQEKIWVGTKLKDNYGYEIPSDKTGELWAISAHPNGVATVLNGEFKGQALDQLWQNHRELFGNQKGEVFPLLTKIIDAQDDLSVQVHPDDAYGLAHEGELGKTECWYVLSADPGSKIIYGHTAETKEELRKLIETGQWDQLLKEVEVKAGDFYYVPSGTIHALGSGVMVLETQQSSDTTYRLYDYDRVDDEGNPRDLHIEESIDVTTVPAQENPVNPTTKNVENGQITTLVSNQFFTVYEWKIDGPVSFTQESFYTLVSVIDGEGTLEIEDKYYPISKGDHFILPNPIQNWTLKGNLHIIASHP